MRANIDADVLLYKCGFAAQHTLYHVMAGGSDASCYIDTYESAAEMKEATADMEDIVVEKEVVAEHVSHAIHNVYKVVERTVEESGCNDYQLILSGNNNFRDDVATTLPYKGNRIDAPKPVHYEALKESMTRKHPIQVTKDIEADDLLGILQTEDTVICSIDKDLLMIEGHHYNLDTGDVVYQTPQDAVYAFARQLLTGDRTDNIPGLRKIGNARADKLLEEHGFGGIWDVAEAMYLEQYGDSFVIWEQAILLWMLRTYDQIKKPIDFRRYLCGEIGPKEN